MRRPRLASLRHLLLTSAAAAASACASTHVERGPVRSSLPTSGRNGELRLSLRNGTEVHLFHPRIEGDSVLGWSVPNSEAPEYRVAVAKDDVLSVAVRKGDTFKTVLAVTAGSFAFLVIITVVSCASATSTY